MLPVPGPLPINPVQKPDEGNLFLRVNQKVAGEILQVSNEQVVLSIQGVQVVARLTTPEQMTELIDRRFAQFVVKEFNPNAVLLQLVDTNQASKPVAQSIGQQETLVVQQLLQRMNIKADPASMLIAQELINQGIADKSRDDFGTTNCTEGDPRLGITRSQSGSSDQILWSSGNTTNH